MHMKQTKIFFFIF